MLVWWLCWTVRMTDAWQGFLTLALVFGHLYMLILIHMSPAEWWGTHV